MTNSDLVILSKEAEKQNSSWLQARWNALSNEQQSMIEELYQVCLRHGRILPVDELVTSL